MRRVPIIRPQETVREERPAVTVEIHLTQREMDVVRMIVAGKTRKEIMHELAISKTRITQLCGMLFLKAGVPNAAALAAWAVRKGLA